MWRKKRVQVCLCFQTLPGFGQQPGFSLVLFPNPRFLSFIDFYFVLFYFVCFPQTSHLSSAERPESAENPTGKTFPGWKPPPGRNGTLGFEGKKSKSKEFYQVSGGRTARSLCHARSPGTRRCRSRTRTRPAGTGERRSTDLSNISLDLTPGSSQPLPSASI